MYQVNTVDCTLQDTTYSGDWYCADMTVCEAGISASRSCIKTRGCAKYEQCVESSTIMSNYAVQVNGVSPGGMSIELSCCKSSTQPDDDAIAIDYNMICNEAGRGRGKISGSTSILMSIIIILLTIFIGNHRIDTADIYTKTEI